MRQRMLAIAGLTAATLALGGLTACEDGEEPTGQEDAGSQETGDQESGTGQDAGDAADAGDAGEEAGTDDGVFAAGETAAYDDGLEITVSAPEPYTPSEYAIGHTEGNDPYTFTVTVENTGEAGIDVTLLLPVARTGERGAEAEEIYDDVVGGGFTGEVLPGRSASAEYAFDIPADAAAIEVQIDHPMDFEAAPALWELPL